MEEFKILTFKEISDALNAGKLVEVKGSDHNPFKIRNGYVVDGRNTETYTSNFILAAMRGMRKARIIEPKVTLWIVICKIGTNVYQSENIAKNDELLRREQGTWLRTVKIEV